VQIQHAINRQFDRRIIFHKSSVVVLKIGE
jgi:hypothetical protein